MNQQSHLPLFLEAKYYRYFTPTETLHINQAFLYANVAHFGQLRSDGSPYIYHPVRMVHILLDEHRIYDTELIITELLHDVREVSKFMFINATVMLWFGLKNERNMNALTKTNENKKVYLQDIASSGNWRIILAKLDDRLDNMQTLEGLDPEFQKKQARETRELFLPLCSVLAKVIPKQYARVAPLLHIRLTALCEKYGC